MGGTALNVSAARLATAAHRLHSHQLGGKHTEAIARMTTLPVTDWTPRHVEAAAAILSTLTDQLVQAGVDPMLLPTPPLESPTTEATHHAPARPFIYDGTIDGLRGIPLIELDTVSPTTADRFSDYGMHSVYDLLCHVPLRYIDRTARTPITELRPGESGTTIARVTSSSAETTRTGRRVARIVIGDDTGRVSVTFFNAAWQAKRFQPGDEVVAQGRVEQYTTRSGRTLLTMTNPLLDVIGEHTAYVVPIYPQSTTKAGLTTWQIHRAAREAVTRLGNLSDPIPARFTTAQDLLTRGAAFAGVHHPSHAGDEHRARERLAFDELLRMQLALLMHKHHEHAQTGHRHVFTGNLATQLRVRFPYPLTNAQQRAVSDVETDMRGQAPMHRLLQGDVGSGKTVVAAHMLLAAIESGGQAALMAPTEILATQHHHELADLLSQISHPATGAPLRIDALTNKVRSNTRRDTLAALAAGQVDIVVGTHALLVDDVAFANLTVIVVDEQHRFGVQQRSALRDKAPTGTTPDMLVMTATPIPRTAAMTVFGDLDTSVLDELPPGRTPIDTTWIDEPPALSDPTSEPWAAVRDQVAHGRQAYVVCPLVTESETLAAASATETHQVLESGALHGLRLGLVHGKQRPADRAATMDSFARGDLDVLVATTVIEVGVNVPNASIIVILDPARFGIAQLHQLRGRVGRAQHASHCLLVGQAATTDAADRLGALCTTTDGFALSETDLRIRGAGAVLGQRQSGVSDLRVASLEADRDLLAAARHTAIELLAEDPKLDRRPALAAEVRTALGPDAEQWLTSS